MAKLLIIDDERGIRNTLREILADEGHEVEIAENGKQGLERAQAKAFDALLDFHKRLPKYRTLFLLGVPKNGDVDVAAKTAQCAEAGFWAFCPGLCANDRPLTPDEADAVRATGMSFRVYGVNTPEALTVARDIGAEAFTCNHWRKAFEWAREIGGVELLA